MQRTGYQLNLREKIMRKWKTIKAIVRVVYRWALALVLTFVAPVFAKADFLTSLTAQAIQEPSGQFAYTYSVTNLPNSTDTFGGFTVNVDPLALISGIEGPTGWDSSIDTSNNLVAWTSSSPSTDILPGLSGTFSFFSPLPPISQNFLAIGFSDAGIDFNSGTTIGPGPLSSNAVPEPTSLTLLALGSLSLLGYGCRRRKAVA
jgi:hypothetical protein